MAKIIRTALIDDNPHALQILRDDLARMFPEVEIVGEADGVVQGAKLLRQVQPDLLLLDIQMGDGTGFDLLEIVPDLRFQVIFTTAHDEHAIRAFRFAAVDYLLKPIDPEELRRAVSRAKKLLDLPVNPQQIQVPILKEHIQQRERPRTIALHTADKIHVARLNEILRMEADGNYTEVHFVNGTKLLLTKTLKDFSQILEETGFLRLHQSHLVNFEHIREFIKTDGGYIVMADGAKVPVAVRKRAEVVERLGV
ncbi:MAG: response regulator [Saprospiraceae bacterium]|jgi:two-component system LytT family response regulator|nr:response regulator [Saprospiraceae bacterium]